MDLFSRRTRGVPHGESVVGLPARALSGAGARDADRGVQLFRRLLPGAAARAEQLAAAASLPCRLRDRVPVLPATAHRRRVQGLRGGQPLSALPRRAARSGHAARTGRCLRAGRAHPVRAGDVAGAVAGAVAGDYLDLPGPDEQGVLVAEWLKKRHILYMVSHMAIMPLVDFYATACDWWPTGEGAPRGLIWFVVVSYFNGMVIEIGRKIRGPQDEEVGVNTYSALWGMRTA